MQRLPHTSGMCMSAEKSQEDASEDDAAQSDDEPRRGQHGKAQAKGDCGSKYAMLCRREVPAPKQPGRVKKPEASVFVALGFALRHVLLPGLAGDASWSRPVQQVTREAEAAAFEGCNQYCLVPGFAAKVLQKDVAAM